MANFYGKHKCKVDSKGRISFPAKFLRQLPNGADKSVFISIGLDGCLHIRAKAEWEQLTSMLRNNLSPFNRKHRSFKRMMLLGAEEVDFDSANRMLIPKLLFKELIDEKEVLLLGLDDLIELWGLNKYGSLSKLDAGAFDDLGEELFGGELNVGKIVKEDE